MVLHAILPRTFLGSNDAFYESLTFAEREDLAVELQQPKPAFDFF